MEYLSKYLKFKGKDIVLHLMKINWICMPALIGGFFRRGRVVKDNYIEIYYRKNYNKETI